jgi:hypothetical protein
MLAFITKVVCKKASNRRQQETRYAIYIPLAFDLPRGFKEHVCVLTWLGSFATAHTCAAQTYFFPCNRWLDRTYGSAELKLDCSTLMESPEVRYRVQVKTSGFRSARSRPLSNTHATRARFSCACCDAACGENCHVSVRYNTLDMCSLLHLPCFPMSPVIRYFQNAHLVRALRLLLTQTK